jgi:hypothetical protein
MPATGSSRTPRKGPATPSHVNAPGRTPLSSRKGSASSPLRKGSQNAHFEQQSNGSVALSSPKVARKGSGLSSPASRKASGGMTGLKSPRSIRRELHVENKANASSKTKKMQTKRRITLTGKTLGPVMRDALSSICREDFRTAADARKSFARGIVDPSQLAAFQDMDSLSVVNLDVEKDTSTNEEHRRETVRRKTQRLNNNSDGKSGSTPLPNAEALVPKTQAEIRQKHNSIEAIDSKMLKMSKTRAEMSSAKSPQHRALMAGKHMHKSKMQRTQRRTLTNPLCQTDMKSLQHFEAQVRAHSTCTFSHHARTPSLAQRTFLSPFSEYLCNISSITRSPPPLPLTTPRCGRAKRRVR